MFDHLEFEIPSTARAAYTKSPALPAWADTMDFDLETVDSTLQEIEANKARQRKLRSIFGMISLVDENVAKLWKVLQRYGIEDDTVLVFTSGKN